jgi:hypothetical protein
MKTNKLHDLLDLHDLQDLHDLHDLPALHNIIPCYFFILKLCISKYFYI